MHFFLPQQRLKGLPALESRSEIPAHSMDLPDRYWNKTTWTRLAMLGLNVGVSVGVALFETS